MLKLKLYVRVMYVVYEYMSNLELSKIAKKLNFKNQNSKSSKRIVLNEYSFQNQIQNIYSKIELPYNYYSKKFNITL